MSSFGWLRRQRGARDSRRKTRAGSRRRASAVHFPSAAEVETLESRLMLAGTAAIQGAVFEDVDEDGEFDQGEDSGIPLQVVYIDGNNNDTLDTTQTTLTSTTPLALRDFETVSSTIAVSGLG